MIIIPIISLLNGYNWEYTLFSDKPMSNCHFGLHFLRSHSASKTFHRTWQLPATKFMDLAKRRPKFGCQGWNKLHNFSNQQVRHHIIGFWRSQYRLQRCLPHWLLLTRVLYKVYLLYSDSSHQSDLSDLSLSSIFTIPKFLSTPSIVCWTRPRS